MSEAKTAIIRYIFMDIVDFSINRTVEAQSEIIEVLNNIVKDATSEQNLPDDSIIYLPTGDGICICLLNQIDPYDIHMRVSFGILKRLENHNQTEADARRRLKVRIGINENQDNIITDINNQKNVAGLGVNMAQRIMSIADPLQVNVGESVYERLSQREAYSQKFRKRTEEVKHGVKLTCYQYVNSDASYLDSRVPGKPQKDEKMPRQVAVYHALLDIFRSDIEKHYDEGSCGYSLSVLLCYITMDIIEYTQTDDLERRKWRSKTFKEDINSFAKAFQVIDKSQFWLIVDAGKCCRRELLLDVWAHIFKQGFLSGNKNYAKMVAGQWPGLQRQVIGLLSGMYSWYES